jgi:hypothetical protein
MLFIRPFNYSLLSTLISISERKQNSKEIRDVNSSFKQKFSEGIHTRNDFHSMIVFVARKLECERAEFSFSVVSRNFFRITLRVLVGAVFSDDDL